MYMKPVRRFGPNYFDAVLLLGKKSLSVCVSALCLFVSQAHAERIRDVATLQGVRSNSLVGYGLVVGLDGTGDQTTQTPFTVQSIQAMLSQLGVSLPPETRLQLKNVAAVVVTAQLAAFAKPGQNIDITVSSIGNAKSLRGGTLIMTPLKGVDGQVYALAQGNLLVGGAGASAGGSKTVINHLSAGRIPNGAVVERAVESPFALGEVIRLELNHTDFTTTRNMVEAINKKFGEGLARSLDGRQVEVLAPADPDARVGFVAQMEQLPLNRTDASAKVIVNARTGSVVMNQAVKLMPCAIAHGNLTIQVVSSTAVSQPNALAAGQTVATEQADISVKQDGGQLIALQESASLSDVVKALNSMGANPTDLVSILQALQQAGALRAELEVI
jgi:flagellar P-ring protein precursor FlgI